MDPLNCVRLCGFEPTDLNMKLVKEFCSSAGGSGGLFEREWLQTAGLSVLPNWLAAYRQDVRTPSERDVNARPDVAKTFKDLGCSDRDIQNKVHHVCNAKIERSDCDEANASRSKRAEFVRSIACESDGHPCVFHGGADGKAKVLAAMNTTVSGPWKEFA